MMLFFVVYSASKSLNTYLGFGFIWLSVIISACFVYLIPKDNIRIKRMLTLGIGVYLTATVLCNTMLLILMSLYTLIAVDFFLTFAILIYRLVLYYFGTMKDSQYQ